MQKILMLSLHLLIPLWLMLNIKSKKYAPQEVLNTDQIGLELELHSTRTLSHQGEHITLARVKSKNATTHSYTIQPMILLAGELVRPVFLCLKEPNGKMSDSQLTSYLTLKLLKMSLFLAIKKKLFTTSNVVVTCSSSGKLTSSLVEY